jgi:hypothetical protein
MSFHLRGSQAPLPPFVYPLDGPIRFDEARFGAWARALEMSGDSLPPRRAHRGQLPDVDFSRATPVPRKPSLFARLWRVLFVRRSPGRRTDRTNAKETTVGNSDPPLYMAKERPIAHPSAEEGRPSSRAA